MRWISIIVRALLVPWHALAVASIRLGQRLAPPRYQIRGACQGSGRCCRHLLFAEYPFLTWPLLRGVVRFWLQRIYPFVVTETALMDPESSEYFRVLTCNNLVDNCCAEYWLRPRVCRDWPLAQYERPPILWRGCGFQAIDVKHPDRGDVSHRRDAATDAVVRDLARRFGEKVRSETDRS